MSAGESHARHALPPSPSTLDGYREMWRIAWPVSVSTSTHMLLMVANLFWIGRLGTYAVAAVSLTSHILFITFGMTQIVFAGAVAIVARRTGEENPREAFAASVHAVVLGTLLGVLVSILGWFVSEPIVSFFDVERAVSEVTIPYLQISFAGTAPFFLSMGIGASYQGTGNTRTPLALNAIIVAINIIIDPILIFAPGELSLGGWDVGVAGLGVVGAAYADIVATGLGCIFFILLWLSRYSPFPSHARGRVRVTLDGLWQILRIGAPAGITMLARPLSTFLLLKVIASFGTTALAAFGIVLRAFSLNFIPFAGLNASVATLVGQRLGGGSAHEAKRVVRRGFFAALGISIVLCSLYMIYASPLISIFDSNPEVVATAIPFLMVIALGQLFTGSTMPLAAAMNGAGNTRPPMVAALFANWPVKLPLAYALAVPVGMGTRGIWLGMLVSMLTETAILIFWFRRGRWTQTAV